jgi:lipoate---protein ligase
MQFLDLTLPTAVENVALDEALLDAAEASAAEPGSGARGEVLRLWEPRETIVVVGNSSRLTEEVRLDVCAARGVPVLRRASGGAAIVSGPGCLMYAVVLSYELRPELRLIDHAHHFVLDTIAAALNKKVPGVACNGISDMVLGDKKFSGNSLRCKRNYFLYHGTLLYQFPLEQVGELLKMPNRQPTYRQARSHADFITNLPTDAATLRQSLVAAFSANEKISDWPQELTRQLVAEKYSQKHWNQKL